MRLKPMAIGALALFTLVVWQRRSAHSSVVEGKVTRIAEIELDPQQVEPYKAALREGIDAAIRLEPGVIALYAISVKDHPEQVRVFEVYASAAAYQHHLQTPHFKKFKAATQRMVRSLKLIETDPILLRSKAGFGQ